MTRITSFAAAIALLLCLAAADLSTSWAQPPVNLAFATLDTGSAWYVYGATMAELFRKALPAGSNIDVKPRSGGVGNPRLVAKNETPLGFGFTVTNRWAFEGKEAYDAKHENLRALVGGLDTYYLVATASKKLPIASIKEIKDRRPRSDVHPAVGSLGEFAGASSCARPACPTPTSVVGRLDQHVATTSVDAFKDGRADILFAVITPKHPSVSEIVSSVDVKFIGLDPATVSTLAPLGYNAATMPAETFKGQSEPVKTVGFPTVLITNKELPDAIAYTVTKAVVDNKDALVRGHAGLVEFDRTKAGSRSDRHPAAPGAERVYREKGWMK